MLCAKAYKHHMEICFVLPNVLLRGMQPIKLIEIPQAFVFFSRNVIARNAAAAKTAPMLENSVWQSRFSRNEKPISHTSSQADFGNCCCQCKNCVQFPSAANGEAHPSWRSTNDCAASLLRFSFFVEFWGQMLLKWSKIFFACGGLLGFYCFSPK